jgi:xanthine dehydrogenase accessory factor
LLEPLERERDAAFLDRVLETQRARQSLSIVTNVATGARQLLEEGSSTPPEIAGLASRRSRLVETPEGDYFLHAWVPPVRLIIAGATHVGQVLSALAQTIGYEVIVVDPRAAFASEERFGETQTVNAWPEVSLATLGVDARTAIVALTHAAHIDDEALAAALRSPCLYIGALGSKRTQANRIERLQAMGFSEAELARIHAPVGLAIGAEGPAEIAVSILAEIIKVAHGEG